MKKYQNKKKILLLSQGIIELTEKYKTEQNKRINLESELKTKSDELKIIKSSIDKKATFLTTEVSNRDYEHKIKEIITNAENSIDVIIPHWDNTLVNIFLKKDQECKTCKIRIVARNSKDEMKFHTRAIEELKKCFKADLRYNSTIHARILIVDKKQLIVGSADLNSTSLSNSLEAGIHTQENQVVSDAQDFFERVWTESK